MIKEKNKLSRWSLLQETNAKKTKLTKEKQDETGDGLIRVTTMDPLASV